MYKLSREEKWEFVNTLYKNGSRNSILKKKLQHWDDSKIQKSKQQYRACASRLLKKRSEDSIDMWHELITRCHEIEGTAPVKASQKNNSILVETPENYLFLLSKSMQYAACFEEHFQGSSPDEPNYNEIYRYLSQLLAGDEPTQLRPGNATKILEMLSKLNEFIKDEKNIEQHLNYLAEQHCVSYLKPGADFTKIVREKNEKFLEEVYAANEVSYRDCEDAAGSSKSDVDLESLIEEEKKEINLKQRKLANSIMNVAGMNPLEIPLPFLVIPPSSASSTEVLPLRETPS